MSSALSRTSCPAPTGTATKKSAATQPPVPGRLSSITVAWTANPTAALIAVVRPVV
ncbi:hypothetical protein ACFLIM_20200 [Nonomuraea sp. M3C6]|uniref:Uncharacterized protein n=1 Tax=Nonomuraea marmarensis TaxID=3351344 RepID=A0ABW7ADU7_9ACTN